MLFTAYNRTDSQPDRQTDSQTSITAAFLRVKLNILNMSHLNG